MEKVIEVLNRMKAEGVIQNFAIGGGIASIYYLEPYLTDDIDVFISPVAVGEGGLISFGEIYSYLEKLGYHAKKEYIQIEDWLVQFLPASHSVQQEAVTQGRTVAYGETHTVIFSAEHLAAELLRSGRLKDLARVEALLGSDGFSMQSFNDIVFRNGLAEKWNELLSRLGKGDR